ncbi:hypothetical protein [Nocardia implantans]|uniref:Uncharacterized protein n=1 Tax=Nocardia implantans TaxID=3108168 RepID=A0ABU6ASG4_9NOCA|nr:MULTISPECIES: hypothetical protein [unclassified Nocardia]MBF6191857.1 hypothetical protein [Nocardia beijingensis]MEA3527831.1 hypothetical protein [Nocardia sp. CDC192]MEB3510418.1 hypothetical protein [Nocardia sp. CDC186]
MPDVRDDDSAVPTAEQFARAVLRAAAKPERIASVVELVVGDRIEAGPIRVGPARLAVAAVEGRPGIVRAAPCEADGWDVGVEVPVMLRLRISMIGVVARFAGAVAVRLRFALLPEDACTLLVYTEDVGTEHVDVEILPLDRAAKVIDRFGDVRAVVADHIVAYLRELLASQEVQQIRRIDVGELIERAWDSGLLIPPPLSGRDGTERRGA